MGPTEKQVVATKVLFSSFGRKDIDDDKDAKEEEAMGTAEVVGISDEEENDDVAPPSQESVLVEGEESPELPISVKTTKAGSTSLLLFSTFGAEQNEEEEPDQADDSEEEVEIKIAEKDDQEEVVSSVVSEAVEKIAGK